MSYDLHYNPTHFASVEVFDGTGQRRTVDRQSVWAQLDDERWIEVTIERAGTAFQRRVYPVEAMIRADQRPHGGWRHAQPAQHGSITLVEDASAPASPAPAPPTGPKSPIAAAYIEKRYGTGMPEPRPDIHALRRKMGFH